MYYVYNLRKIDKNQVVIIRKGRNDIQHKFIRKIII